MQLPTIHRELYTLRPWHPDDAIPLVRHANNKKVAISLRDAFPHPYSLSDARKWLNATGNNREDIILAIEVNGEPAGGIGMQGLKDVYRHNGELGYWLSERYWGRGIMTDAVGVLVDHAFVQTGWQRLFASIFENNIPSMRVLEKNGFTREAVHRKSVIKEGVVMDEVIYALHREQWRSGSSHSR